MTDGTQVHQGLRVASGYRPIYAIFEGGGAKGIAHIGALQALEHEQLEIVGVAGSSAGAIVAALVALGFKSHELFDTREQTDILQPHGPIDVLGRGSWRRYGLIRRFLPWLLGGALVAMLAALVLTHTYASVACFALDAMVGSLLLAIALVWPVLSQRGLFDSTHLRSVLNEIFLTKLNEHLRKANKPEKPAGHRVRFADINPALVSECATLKIIVSDVRSGQLQIFDHNRGEVVVADAVAASASIPFAFRPPSIEGAERHDPETGPEKTRKRFGPIYVDGGLISNLPVWSFSAEKRALERTQGGPPIPIIAFSLDGAGGSTNPVGRKLPPWNYLVKVISTGIFGSQQVIQRFVADLITIELRSSLSTMRFDCDRNDAIGAFDAGYRCASGELLRLRRVAEITTKVLESILAFVRAEVEAQRRADGAALPRLRINLIDPIDDRMTAFRIVASLGMEGDADDRLELDGRNHIAPRAFQQGVPQFDIVYGAAAETLKMTKYEHALVSPTLHSIICLPIFAPRSPETVPERVLCIDSSDDLQAIFNNSWIMTELGDLAVTASRTLILKATGVS